MTKYSEISASENNTESPPLAVTLSAESPFELQRVCFEAAELLLSGRRSLSEISKNSLLVPAKKLRRAIVSSSAREAALLLKEPQPTARASTLIFAFPGQGASGPVPARELARVMPVFCEYLTRAEAVVSSEPAAAELSIYPLLARGRARTSADEQIAVFVYGAAAAFQYMAWGAAPDMMLPHSLGELTAMAVSKMACFEDILRFVCRRAALIDAIKERGVMTAMEASYSCAMQLAARYEGLSVAAVNSGTSVVLSGKTEAMIKAERDMEMAKIAHHRLRVPNAAHSCVMEPALSGIKKLAFPKLSPPFCPVYSSLDGRPLEAGDASSPRWRAAHCRCAVRFDLALCAARAQCEEGGALAVEFGVHRVLAAPGATSVPNSRWLGASSMSRYHEGKSQPYCFKRGIMETMAALWENGFVSGTEWAKLSL
ncbi:MAG: acyltransferase domain-containing protein [Cloacibacillus sp.]